MIVVVAAIYLVQGVFVVLSDCALPSPRTKEVRHWTRSKFLKRSTAVAATLRRAVVGETTPSARLHFREGE